MGVLVNARLASSEDDDDFAAHGNPRALAAALPAAAAVAHAAFLIYISLRLYVSMRTRALRAVAACWVGARGRGRMKMCALVLSERISSVTDKTGR